MSAVRKIKHVVCIFSLVVVTTPIAAAMAQCPIISTLKQDKGNGDFAIYKYFPFMVTRRVVLLMSMNVRKCQAGKFMTLPIYGSSMATEITAYANTMDPSPRSCQWLCYGPTVNQIISITNADCLPVELLDFKVSALDPPTPEEPAATAATTVSRPAPPALAQR